MNTARIVVLANGFGAGVIARCRASGPNRNATPFGSAATAARSSSLRTNRIDVVRSGIAASATMQA